MPTFHERKQKRIEYYEKHIKGWRLTDCTACNGSGKYDHSIKGKTPDCYICEGTGKERVKPECQTDIEPLIGQVLRLEISESVDLHVYIRNRREAIYQFVGTDDGTKDPRQRVKLRFGYDDIEGVTDWYIGNSLGSQFYLHQFERVTAS